MSISGGLSSATECIPVHRLVPELLVDIFFILRDIDPSEMHVSSPQDIDSDDSSSNTQEGSNRYLLGWMLVTHVCRRWRQVALEAASLWSSVCWNDLPRPWIEEMLLRSGDAPLSVSFPRSSTGPDAEYASMLTRISQERHRIRALQVNDPHDIFKSIFADKPLPILYSLELDLRPPIPKFFTFENLVYPDDFLASSATHLRQLKLWGSHFSWTSELYTGLTFLQLADVHNQMTLADLTTLLGRTRHLETLVLLSTCPTDVPDAPASTFIPLPPSLKKLTLHGSEEQHRALELLRRLNLPPTTPVELTQSIRSGDDKAYHATTNALIRDCLARYAGPASPATALCVQFPSVNNSFARLALERTTDSCPCNAEGANGICRDGADIAFTWKLPEDPVGTILLGTRPGFPLDHVVDLHVDVDAKSAPADWRPLLRRLTRVRRIKARDTTLWSMFATHSSVEDEFLVPHLEELRLLTRFYRGPDENLDHDVERLIEFLRIRKEVGAPIREIHLPKRYSESSKVGELVAIVQRVEWSDLF